jgi:hypothetical protein
MPAAPVSSAGEALCVRVRWGAHRVATHVLDAGLADEALPLGPGVDADVVLSREHRPAVAVFLGDAARDAPLQHTSADMQPLRGAARARVPAPMDRQVGSRRVEGFRPARRLLR